MHKLARFCGKRDVEELTAEKLYEAYGIYQTDGMTLFNVGYQQIYQPFNG